MMRETSLDEHADHHDGDNSNKAFNGSRNLSPLAPDTSLRMLQKDIGNRNRRQQDQTTTTLASNECSRNELDEEARSSRHARSDREDDVVASQNNMNSNNLKDNQDDDEEEKKQDDDAPEASNISVRQDQPSPRRQVLRGNSSDEQQQPVTPRSSSRSVSPLKFVKRQNPHKPVSQDYLRRMSPTKASSKAGPPTMPGAPSMPTGNSAPKRAGTSWWERVVVQRSSYVVEDLVEQYTADSQFLHSEPFPVAWLDRIEIETGDLLGAGTYSNVYQVKKIHLLPDFLKDHVEQDTLRTELGDANPPEEEEKKPPPTAADDERDAAAAAATTRSAPPPVAKTNKTRATTTGYAIKHLKAELLQNSKLFEAAAADLIMEAKFLARLSHPNILRIRGMALGGTSTFAATGLFDSYFLVVDELKETLIQRIHRWKVQGSTDQYRSAMVLYKLRLAVQVASALAYLHERRLVFRDLKPHNIGIREDGTVQLFDFGFCRELPAPETSLSPKQVASSGSGARRMHMANNNNSSAPRKTASGDADEEEEEEKLYCMSGKGTLLYMASEVLSSRCYNQKADVYSWAMVTYELLTLQKPFAVGSIEQHKKSVCERGQRPPLHHLRWLSMGVKQLLQHAWQADVQARWPMMDVKECLEELIQELENNRMNFSKEASFASYTTAPKGFLCHGIELDDIILDLSNSVQTRYDYFAKAIFCQRNTTDTITSNAKGESQRSAAKSTDTHKAPGAAAKTDTKKVPDSPKAAAKEPSRHMKNLAKGVGAIGVKSKVPTRSRPRYEEQKDLRFAATAGSFSTAIFGHSHQRSMPQTQERFLMASLCMNSVRLTAAKNRRVTASASYSAYTRTAAQSTNDAARQQQQNGSSQPRLELEATIEVPEETSGPEQPGDDAKPEPIIKRKDPIMADRVVMQDKLGTIQSQSEDESRDVTESSPPEGTSPVLENRGSKSLCTMSSPRSSQEGTAEAKPEQDDQQPYIVSTASV